MTVTIAIISLLAMLSLGLYLTAPPSLRLPEAEEIPEEKDPYLRSLARVISVIDTMTAQEGQLYLSATQRLSELGSDECIIITAGPVTLWAFPPRRGYIMTTDRLGADGGDVGVFAYIDGDACYRRSVSFVPRSVQDAFDLWESIREEEEDNRSESS